MAEKIKVLAADGLEAAACEKLEALGFVVENKKFDPDALCDAVKEYDALIVRSATKMRTKQIDAAAEAGKLKIIIRGGVGLDNIDVDYARGKGIVVKNTPTASSDAVAELALAHMFSCARYISAAGDSMRKGKWEKKAYSGFELKGKTVGIIGFGRIGQSLAAKCQALGMNILAYDVFKNPTLENEHLKYAELDTVLSEADIVSLHVPALGSKPIIDRDAIAKMKDGAVLINTSRGSNVDEEALLEALDNGKLYAAGLDVFNEEPSANEKLYTHPRVSATPHIGASTKEAQKRIGEEIVSILKEQFC